MQNGCITTLSASFNVYVLKGFQGRMTEIAFLRFFYSATILYNAGLIAHKVYYVYLTSLYDLLEDGNEHKYFLISFISIFKENEHEETIFFVDGDFLPSKFETVIQRHSLCSKRCVDNLVNSVFYDEDNKTIKLQTSRSGVLHSYWEFHKFDNDDYPSIPHGHNMKHKLNVYTRCIIDTNKPRGKDFFRKESKDFMRWLWNDNQFYELFISTINYHISRNYNFKVPHPLRIPKSFK